MLMPQMLLQMPAFEAAAMGGGSGLDLALQYGALLLAGPNPQQGARPRMGAVMGQSGGARAVRGRLVSAYRVGITFC